MSNHSLKFSFSLAFLTRQLIKHFVFYVSDRVLFVGQMVIGAAHGLPHWIAGGSAYRCFWKGRK
jgi:hypothetical protein